MNNSEYIARVASGKHGHEHLSREEAQQAFAHLLSPDADPLQTGAFLIAERIKGETSPELAGFVDATRSFIPESGDMPAAIRAVDMPCYAGKRRASHTHLLAALKARDEGIPIVIHGLTRITGRISAWQVLKSADVKRAPDLSEARKILAGEGIVYLDMEEICPNLHRILQLRERLGVRSFAHTVARMLNPLGCAAQINGMFHTPYAMYMAQANCILAQPRSLIFMGAEGEPELYADRQKRILLQRGEHIHTIHYPDAGADNYPKQIMADVQVLQQRFPSLQSGTLNNREQAVLERMLQAFRLLSDNTVPESWTLGLNHK